MAQNLHCPLAVLAAILLGIAGCKSNEEVDDDDTTPTGDDDDTTSAGDDDDVSDDDTSTGDDDDATVESVSVGPDGGSLTIEGIVVTIPAGALDETLEIEASLVAVALLPDAPDGANWRSTHGLVLEPHGQTFAVPIQIALTEPAELVLRLDDEADTDWEQVWTLYIDPGTVTTIFADHFSVWGWFDGSVPYCGDESCDAGEDCDSCPADCNDWDAQTVLNDCTGEQQGVEGTCCDITPISCCGSGLCYGDEDHNYCVNGQLNHCGDGFCTFPGPNYWGMGTGTETCETCPEDCGSCRNGDMWCSESYGETCDLVPADCNPESSLVECPECCGGWVCVTYEVDGCFEHACEPP